MRHGDLMGRGSRRAHSSRRRPVLLGMLIGLAINVLAVSIPVYAELNLRPLQARDWSPEHSAHLLSRAGFGGTREQVQGLAALSPRNAVALVVYGAKQRRELPDFVHSGIFSPGLDPFPPSRPATTALARAQGHALGVQVKPGGNRPLQPVVNQFFYWLRASRLETDRVAYWWANRMLTNEHPLQEKMALFWHGHFATNEDKVRDYRKMLQQLMLFQRLGLGNFRELLLNVARDPAMLVFLDAGVNTKDSPNENFAREIMELFTMGVGHYAEVDVQEAARAFTGWNVRGLNYHLDQTQHDSGEKTFLGQRGNFTGEQIIDLILAQPATAEFIAGNIYRYFVHAEIADAQVQQLGQVLRDLDYDLGAFMRTLLLSEHFYQKANRGSRIKSPVELLVSTYRRLGLVEVPGVPDFNTVSAALGQHLLHPPTVAGWSHGTSWITPSLMFARSNFVLDVLFPDISFVPPDRYPAFVQEVANVQQRLRQGMSVTAATRPTGVETETLAASNLMADRDEDFNTRLGSMRGWQMALERVLPIPRRPARLQLVEQVLAAELSTTEQVVSHFTEVFFLTPPSVETQKALADWLREELGTDDIQAAASYLEEPLRILLHRLLSLPEYQLG
ncbi:MAG: DUF1800 domain-containing protein [Pseudomonadota bacterium]